MHNSVGPNDPAGRPAADGGAQNDEDTADVCVCVFVGCLVVRKIQWNRETKRQWRLIIGFICSLSHNGANLPHAAFFIVVMLGVGGETRCHIRTPIC